MYPHGNWLSFHLSFSPCHPAGASSLGNGKEHAYHEALLRDPVSSPAKSVGNPSFDYTPLPGPAISPRARLHFYQTLNDEAPAG